MTQYAKLLEATQKAILRDEKTSAAFHRPERLGIYSHAYIARLTGILMDDYPLLCASLGKDSFDALVHEYITESPSRFRDAGDYSQAFADFLTRQHNRLPAWASDLARSEAAEARLAEMSALPAYTIPPQGMDVQEMLGLRLILQPAHTIIPTRFDLTATPPTETDDARYIHYRFEDEIRTLRLSPAEAEAATGLDGRIMMEWLQAMAATRAAELQELPHWLQRWAANGLLCAAK